VKKELELPSLYLIEAIFSNGIKFPDKVCLRTENYFVTYGELLWKISAAAKYFNDIEIGKRDVVILAASSGPGFIIGYLALHLLQATAIPVSPEITSARFNFINNLVKSKCAFLPDGRYNSIDIEVLDNVKTTQNLKYPGAIKGDAVADLMFTSGTTGEPKGVPLTQDNLRAAVQNINQYIGNCASDVELIPMPLSHSFGLARMRCALYVGSEIVLSQGLGRVKKIFELIEKYQVSGIGMVAPGWSYLHKISGERIGRFASQLKWIEFGSAPMEKKDKILLMRLLPNTRICMHYGLTEASRATFIEFHAEKLHLHTIGKPSPLTEIGIFDNAGARLSKNTVGEICIKGEMVINNYYKMSSSSESFVGDYFRSGDLGFIDDNGYIVLAGRKKEMINVGGRKVNPHEIELALSSLEEISEAACVAMVDPNKVSGELVLAYVVPTYPEAVLTLDQIRGKIKHLLEQHMIPSAITMVSEIPKTDSGKIKRIQLKNRQ
jgi:long-chain acyl-CoA synthetase